MIVRRKIATNRYLASQTTYFAEFIFVANNVAGMISYQQTRKIRLCKHICKNEELGFQPPMVKKMGRDLALTLNMHPSSLGLLHETGGSLSLPAGVKIKASLVTNIFSWP